jgi:hypothetical protein
MVGWCIGLDKGVRGLSSLSSGSVAAETPFGCWVLLGGWLVGWLAGWFVGLFVGWLFGWLAGWLVGWSFVFGCSWVRCLVGFVSCVLPLDPECCAAEKPMVERVHGAC